MIVYRADLAGSGRPRPRQRVVLSPLFNMRDRRRVLFPDRADRPRSPTRLLPSRPDSDDPSQATPPRSICARHPGSGDVLRSTRGAAHRRRDRANADRRCSTVSATTNDRALAERLRKMDDVRRRLYTAVKLYLTADFARGARGAATGAAGPTSCHSPSTWSKWRHHRADHHRRRGQEDRQRTQLFGSRNDRDLATPPFAVDRRNLRLRAVACFSTAISKSAHQLLAQKVLFRELERAYADSHLDALPAIPGQHRDARRCISTSSPTCANQFAHLLDRLPDPRTGWRAGEDPSQGAGRDRAIRKRRVGRNGDTDGDEDTGEDGWQKRKPHSSGSVAPIWSLPILWPLEMPAPGITWRLVLGAGLLHAGWNALLKGARGRSVARYGIGGRRLALVRPGR